MSIPIPTPQTINTIVIRNINVTVANSWNGVAWVIDEDGTTYDINYNVTDNGVIMGRGSVRVLASAIPTTKPEFAALLPILEAKVATEF